jgi:hypothetical protein
MLFTGPVTCPDSELPAEQSGNKDAFDTKVAEIVKEQAGRKR